MKARHRLLVVALVALLLTRPAWPFPIIGDPDTAALLGVVETLLRTVTAVELAAQEIIQRRIDTLVSHVAYPASVVRSIGQTLRSITRIRDEAEALTCDWRFTSRTALLRDLNLGPLTLCKPSFQLAWGEDGGHWDSDLEEMHDYVGTLSANMLSHRVESEETWSQAFPAVEALTASVWKSPGEANREEAVALSGAGLVADSNSALQTQTLLLQQMERQDERFQDRKQLDMAQFLLVSATGVDPWSVPPPAE